MNKINGMGIEQVKSAVANLRKMTEAFEEMIEILENDKLTDDEKEEMVEPLFGKVLILQLKLNGEM